MAQELGRRDILRAGLGLGLGLTIGPGLVATQDEPASVRPKEGDLLVKSDDSAKKPLTPSDIPAGAAPVTAWAMDPSDQTVRSGSRFNQLLLLHIDSDRLSEETRSRAADGVVAYTTVCPHSGCDVDDWIADQRVMSCSCHASVFDPKDGGKVLDGPAPRALPALPLRVVEGRLVVAGPFTARVGFEPGV